MKLDVFVNKSNITASADFAAMYILLKVYSSDKNAVVILSNDQYKTFCGLHPTFADKSVIADVKSVGSLIDDDHKYDKIILTSNAFTDLSNNDIRSLNSISIDNMSIVCTDMVNQIIKDNLIYKIDDLVRTHMNVDDIYVYLSLIDNYNRYSREIDIFIETMTRCRRLSDEYCIHVTESDIVIGFDDV